MPMYKDEELVIHPIGEEDLYSLWELTYKDENPEWKKWDAPYFEHQSFSIKNTWIKRTQSSIKIIVGELK